MFWRFVFRNLFWSILVQVCLEIYLIEICCKITMILTETAHTVHMFEWARCVHRGGGGGGHPLVANLLKNLSALFAAKLALKCLVVIQDKCLSAFLVGEPH